MFGYTRTELEGRNVSIFVPAPFNKIHDSYLERYITTGQPHVVGTTRRVVAMHKVKYTRSCKCFWVLGAGCNIAGHGAACTACSGLRYSHIRTTITTCRNAINIEAFFLLYLQEKAIACVMPP
jgi:hypothetical protein